MAADLNGDGWDDLVVTTQQRVAVLINQQNGTFAKPVYYTIGDNGPTGLVVGDFNHEGVPDIAVSKGRPGYVTVLLGNRNDPGTFGAPNFYPTGGNPVGLTSGDFNNDGLIDLAVVNSQFKQNTVATLIGNGDGTFRRALPLSHREFLRLHRCRRLFRGRENRPDGRLVRGPAEALSGKWGRDVWDPAHRGRRVLRPDRQCCGPQWGFGKPDLVVTPRTAGVRVLLNTTGTVTPPSVGNGLLTGPWGAGKAHFDFVLHT